MADINAQAGHDAQRGDARPSWHEVADAYGARVYTLAYHLTGDPHDAADLAQDVFVRVYRYLDRYRPGTFEGWLYRITRNVFLDHVRRRERQRTESLDDRDWALPASSEPGPADTVERQAFEADLARALARLGPEFRLAVVLCDIEGLSYAEIVRATGWPLGTVRSRIHRGRRQLRGLLQQHGSLRPAGAEHD